MVDFELIPHTADIKIRAYGKNKKELFAHALIGMFQSIQPIADGCYNQNNRIVCNSLSSSHVVELKSIDQESLLVDFLSEALYLSDVYNEAYLNVNVHELTDTYIRATLCGVEIKGFEVVEIKAVTYHELAIQHNDNGWYADIVFDI